MRPRASVVIPTFNGAQRLPRVLAALAAQTSDDESFEVIVVDNASTDETAKVALGDLATRRLRERRIELRVVAEPQKGLTRARMRESWLRAPMRCVFSTMITFPIPIMSKLELPHLPTRLAAWWSQASGPAGK